MIGAPVALVTGASRGIGRAIATRLAAVGFDIAAVDLRHPASDAPCSLETLHGEIEAAGRRCAYAHADVADLEGHEAVLSKILEQLGRVDLLVTNAGIAPDPRLDVLEMTPESFDRVLAVNLRGAVFLAQRVARLMMDQAAPTPGFTRALIFITSVSAEHSSTNRAEYCVSKAGLSMAARVFADRLAPHGILVFEVRPGIIRTAMTAAVTEKYDTLIAGGLVPERRWGEPDDVARAVVALARGDFDYSTGMIVDVSGGLSIPRL
jgi:NAD(P)-dependent dehydrogenase (short-subunit alcohol dehydrogenase family)